MDTTIVSLFICIAVPLILVLFFLEKKAKQTVLFFIIGMFVCLYISGINGLLLNAFHDDYFYVTTTITPITEEIAKAIPIILFAYVFTSDRKTLITISFALGVGFAVMENAYLILNNNDISIAWAFVRAFGAGLMHSLCTAAVGYGMGLVRERKKLAFCGTFALLTTAIIFHATYNLLVQSDLKVLGFILPVIAYVPLLVFNIVKFIKNKKSAKSAK